MKLLTLAPLDFRRRSTGPYMRAKYCMSIANKEAALHSLRTVVCPPFAYYLQDMVEGNRGSSLP